MSIDLNADVGEGLDDAPLMPLLTSANIACGLHAGSAATIDRSVSLAVLHGVRIGAHPSYADRENFGRTDMNLSSGEVETLVLSQLGAVDAIVRARGGKLSHVKPHGALYNRAARDRELARAVARAVYGYRSDLVLVGLAGSCALEVAREVGLAAAGEAFADRRYLPDGTLMPRAQRGSVLTDAAEAAEQAVHIARDGYAIASDGTRVRIAAATLCLHGDTPGAAALARAVREQLEAAGITVAPLAP
jgi:5-oxoprolinase (ATP-hydrolysing) subunit A